MASALALALVARLDLVRVKESVLARMKGLLLAMPVEKATASVPR